MYSFQTSGNQSRSGYCLATSRICHYRTQFSVTAQHKKSFHIASRLIMSWELHTRMSKKANSNTFEYKACASNAQKRHNSHFLFGTNVGARLSIFRSVRDVPLPQVTDSSPLMSSSWNPYQRRHDARGKLSTIGNMGDGFAVQSKDLCSNVWIRSWRRTSWFSCSLQTRRCICRTTQ